MLQFVKTFNEVELFFIKALTKKKINVYVCGGSTVDDHANFYINLKKTPDNNTFSYF